MAPMANGYLMLFMVLQLSAMVIYPTPTLKKDGKPAAEQAKRLGKDQSDETLLRWLGCLLRI